jgi:hypothetical protein
VLAIIRILDFSGDGVASRGLPERSILICGGRRKSRAGRGFGTAVMKMCGH